MGFDKEASSSSSGLDAAALLPRHGGSGKAHLSSQPKTFANVFIAVVGSGVLGLPYTFSRTGWAAGSVLLLAVAALTYHCMMLLVACRRRLADEHPKIASFGDLGAAVYGAAGRHSVDAMLVLSQASFCVGYLIFIANTLAHLYPIGDPSASSLLLTAKALFIWAMLPFQLGLNSIKTLTLLAPLSIFADVVDLGAMGVVLGQDVSIWLAQKPPVFAFGGPAEILYGLGVAVYAFEGIGMVLPLEAEAADKRKFGGTLGLSMAFIAVMYGLFGAMGYLAFGASTRDIITTNLGAGWLSVTVQLGLCINLFFTMPVIRAGRAKSETLCQSLKRDPTPLCQNPANGHCMATGRSRKRVRKEEKTNILLVDRNHGKSQEETEDDRVSNVLRSTLLICFVASLA